MKRKVIKFSVIGGVAYLFFLITQIPAMYVVSAVDSGFDKSDASVKFFDVDGSLWEGRAAAARIGGRMFTDVRWELEPAALLLGNMSAWLAVRNNDGQMQANVSRSIFGSVQLTDVKGRLAASDLLTLLEIPAIKLGGQFGFNLSELELVDNKLTYAEGRVVWNGAVSQFPQKLQLGDLAVDIKTADDGISAQLKDSGGPLDATGLLTLDAAGAYRFSGKFAARDGRNSSLARALSMLGRAGADGKIDVTNTGNIADFGFFVQ